MGRKELIDLGTLGGDSGEADWINERGEVVGIAQYAVCLQYAREEYIAYGEKTGPGHYSEQQLIAKRPPLIKQAREVLCQGRFPASLIYVLIVSPSPVVPPTFMPLPSRNT